MSALLGTEGFLLLHHREHQGRDGQEQGDEGQYQEIQGGGTEARELRSLNGLLHKTYFF